MLAFKSNHDIQVMIGGLDALLRIFDAINVVICAKRDEEAAANIDRATIGRQSVASLLYAITNRREIAGPLAALYVQRGSCAFMSSPCAKLSLRTVLLELVEQVPHPCDFVDLRGCGSDVTFRAASFLDDYSYRPPGLNHLNLYDLPFFQSEHPLFDTHCVGTHIDEVVPVVVGMRMPFVNDDSPHELAVKRSQCAPVLFKPFRAVSDLVADPKNDEKWIEAFVQWEPTRSGFCREIMANMDDYCRAAMQAQNCIANDEPMAGNDADSDSGEHTGTGEDIDAILDRAASCEQADPAAAEADAFCRLFDEVELELDGESAGDASTFACTLLVFPNSESSITRNGYRGLLGMAAHSTASTNADLRSRGATLEFSLDELRRFVNETTNDEAEPQRSQRYHNERPTEVIKLIIDALEGVPEWSPQSLNVQQSAPPIRPYACMQDVSRAFTLNEQQHSAFTLITTSLLHQELDGLHGGDNGSYRTANFGSRFRHEQLLKFLGGLGDTGKRSVVDVVGAFCLSWRRDDSVVKMALTGKAATLLSRRTLASFLMRIKRAIKEKRFLLIDLVVIDEVSMLSKAEFLRSASYCAATPTRSTSLNADTIYIDPAYKIRASTADVEGFELWPRFSTVVILEESVRFHRVTRRVLTRRDNGANLSTPSLPSLLPAAADATQATPLQVGAGAVFVTPENAIRLAINNAFVCETAAMLPTDTYPVAVVANFKGALNGLSHSDARYVLSLPDSKLGG
ncbi:hypothetical protein PR001_g6714 [Phytophthora rubi]|uniref:ATP-dependent DNA helicase n=1 Tax=Phytophthora rubi TaxID=129364 RepID=A0A6A3NIY3_9STRA|nr:hypothetical protein PR001_g6714 [Phytophthora rubi]